ncbi:MAG: ATP-binding protein, partial [Bacteroidaceae bacterium]
IYKYPNKMVFSNPGIMLISIKQYYQGGESICRNKYLQTMFTFLGSAEKAGSGVDKIIRGWEELNWKRPYLEEKKRPNKVVLTLSMESLLDESVKEGLLRIFGDKIACIPQEQLLTLALAYSEEEITNERLQYALNMHKADITAMLGQMCATHLLESSGYGRGTKYHIYGLNVELPDSNVALLDANVGLNAGLKDPNVALPDPNVALPDPNVALPKRYTKEQLKEKIREVCSDWVTAEVIAARIGRDVNYVKNHVLPKLADVIEKMYDIPHHPRQKYRAKQKEANV